MSVEGTDDAAKTQADFPHLTVVADEGRGLSEAVQLIHANSRPGGGDTAAPTTIFIDRYGTVRWLYRSSAANVRLSPDEVLDLLYTHMPEEAVR